MQLIGTRRRRYIAASGARINAVLNTSPIAYWRQDEGNDAIITDYSGNAYNGAYTGVTWDGTTSPFGKPVPRYDGTSDYGDVYSAGFASAFDLDEFTIMIFLKVANAGVWTDGTVRRVFIILSDANNYVNIYKTSTNNQLVLGRIAAGALRGITLNGIATTSWVSFAISCSIAGGGLLNPGEFRAYQDGAQIDVTKTGCVAATGTGLSTTQTVIGAYSTTPTNVWDGYLAEAIVWGVPMNANILALMT